MYILMRKSTKEEQLAFPTAVATLVKVGKAGEFFPLLSSEQNKNSYFEEIRIIRKEDVENNGYENTPKGWLEYARHAILTDSSEEVIYSAM